MPLILTGRDSRVLRYVFENRVATTDQIRRTFFKDCNDSVARRRIRMLAQCGYLRPCVLLAKQKVIKYFEATEKAFDSVWEKWPFEVDQPKYHSESPYHDIRLGEIRKKFEEITIFEAFYPENILQSSSCLQEERRTREAALIQSDAALLVKMKDGALLNFAIELETSKKTLDRYERKLRSYYSSGQIDGVVYICSSQEIMNVIVKADELVRETNPSMLYCGLESYVLKNKKRFFFKNAKETTGIGFY